MTDILTRPEWTRHLQSQGYTESLTLKMTTTQVVEISVTNSSLSQHYPHPQDHTKHIMHTIAYAHSLQRIITQP